MFYGGGSYYPQKTNGGDIMKNPRKDLSPFGYIQGDEEFFKKSEEIFKKVEAVEEEE